ncbi:MAG TPA: S41 family peptidase, partial [Chitinophagaceae bacterium]
MRVLACIVAALLTGKTVSAQAIADGAAKDAFVITRMAAKFHLQPKPVDKHFSASTFDRLFDELDEERIFFSMEDMKQLLPFRLQLDEEVLKRRTGFITLLASLYESNLKRTDSLIDQLLKSPLDLNTPEVFTVAEDTSYPANDAARKLKLRKFLKATVLNGLKESFRSRGAMDASREKKFIDSLAIVYTKKVRSILKRSIRRELEIPGGVLNSVGEKYCEIIAGYYDPHTSYFSLTHKENYESALGQETMMFGFSLDEDEEERPKIAGLKPGSPAYQSGQLNEGDRIISIQWQGKEAIDVSDASTREVAAIVEASNHDKAKFTVQKADGSKRTVELSKAKMEDDDEGDRVKSFLLSGSIPVGYISLPGFYRDWESTENNLNGCANDVAREIIKLKKENIQALVLDIRYNGGGSVQEAVDLAGIFIDAGPVAIMKDRGEKSFTLKDGNRGTIWDGPLVIMINGFSASASELLAGTLQDYNRAVIVGSRSYGKATGQTVLPMDTTINLEKDFNNRETGSYIKMTLSKLYRINGTTAQFAGVVPDVVLPDIIDSDPHRESNEAFAIPATGTEPNKYFKPLPPINKTGLQQAAANIIETSEYFIAMKKYIDAVKSAGQRRDLPLNWTAVREQKNKY